MLDVLLLVTKPLEKKRSSTDTIVTARDLFEQDRKVAMKPNPAEPVRREAEVASLTSTVGVRDLKLKIFLGLVEKVTFLREEMMNKRTMASEFDASL